MVGVLDRKLLREVRSSGSLLVAITSIIAVGVMCFVYMRSAYYNLSEAQAKYYAQCRMADFWIEVKKVPLADLDVVRRLPDVLQLETRIQFFATVDLPDTEQPLNGLVMSIPDERRPMLNDIVLKRGSYFSGRRDNEVIVNQAFAKRHNILPGDAIHLLLNNKRQELLVVGTAISCEFVYLVGPGNITPDPEHFGVFYLKQSFAEEIFDFDGAANQLVGLLSPAVRDKPDEILRQIETALSPFGVFTTIPRHNQTSNRFLSDEIKGLGVFATIMPSIFLAVAALVLNVLMVRLIDQQRLTIGTFKALGYADRQIFAHFTKFGMAMGLFGGLVGLVLGNRMAVFVTSLYGMFYEFPDLRNRMYPSLYIGGVVVSLCCSLVGSLHGARIALRLNPAEAMRPRPPTQGGAIWLEHIGWLWRRLDFGWRLVLRNVFRNRTRSAVGVFSGAMGAALLVCGFALAHAITFFIDFQFTLISRSDMDLSFADERGRAALLEVQHLPGVDHAEPQFELSCTFVHGPYQRRGGVTGIAPGARLTMPRNKAGEPLAVPPSGLLMTRKISQLLHVRSGDWVRVQPVKGRRDPLLMQVVAISDSYIGLNVYANLEYLNRVVGEEFAITGVQIMTDPRPRVRHELYSELKNLPSLRAVNARADVIENLEMVVKTQRIFIFFIVGFAGVIFFSSLLNTSLIGLAERRREVATLRVLGYTEWQVGRLFLRESLVLNALGTLLGLPLGYQLTYMLTTIYDTEMFRFPLITPPAVWIYSVTLAVIFALAAHAVVQRNINKLDWLDASKTKE